MKKSNLRWIESELPKLVESKILSTDDAERMGEHYRSMKHSSLSSLAVIICSVVGATLIGSGIILLMAHNWEYLWRPVRTFIAFAPLIAGQCWWAGLCSTKPPPRLCARETVLF